jgi:hypothetical protein
MKARRFLLLIDAIINLVLGVILVFFSSSLVAALGVPAAEPAFYPSILGAVLFGIGIALLIGRSNGSGLGLVGAVSINLCGGIVLGLWLVLGNLQLPFRGFALLWGLVAILVGISVIEILAPHRDRDYS